MRQFSTDFTNHIASGATSLCSCWKIERSDGIVLGFTDHDVSLSFDGVAYLPANGLQSSEVTAKLGAQVDTSEVTGILHSSAINQDDIELGRYRGAKVTTNVVNWRDVSMREALRVDVIGEIIQEDGIFRAELRSRLQEMNVADGRRYQPQCDVLVGAARCGIDLEDATFKGNGTVSKILGRYGVEVSGLDGFEPNWFSHGNISWQTGKRLQLLDPLVAHSIVEGITILISSLPVGDWVNVGDNFLVFVGCDRQFSTCKNKFSNGINFQGFPHIPGNDFVLAYPKSDDDFSGKALVN